MTAMAKENPNARRTAGGSMNVPTNASEVDQLASNIVPDCADDFMIVRAARELLAILMMNWVDRWDFRWSADWIRQDLDDVSRVYLELQCADEGIAFQRRYPPWLVWEAIGTLQRNSLLAKCR
jgi:hypothetical protein